jgi:hypothetical protein
MMVEFCKANPGAMVGILAVLGSIVGFLVVVIIGLIKGWWSNTGKTSDAMWARLKVLEDRQFDLRTYTLPDFIKRDELKELKDTWRDMAADLKEFMGACRKGECLAGHLQKIQEGNHI